MRLLLAVVVFAVASQFRVYLPMTADTAALAEPALYVVYGQSNAMGYGEHPQPYQGPALLYRDVSPMPWTARSFTEARWEPLSDPAVPEVGGGSWLPRLATRLGGPVAFLPAARQRMPIARLGSDQQAFAWMLAQPRPATYRTRAVLYWQGESDVAMGTSTAAYRAALAQLALDVRSSLGVPLVVAEVGPVDGFVPADHERIRAAQRDCWATCPNVVKGPSFADLARVGDGSHLRTDAELTMAGDRWYEALVAAGLAH